MKKCIRQKWLKGWKVIMSETRESCVSCTPLVKYEKNKIVERLKGYGALAVFKNRKMAREFVKNHLHRKETTKIVKCLYIRSKHACLWLDLSSTYSILYNVPEGTLSADKVKCLE